MKKLLCMICMLVCAMVFLTAATSAETDADTVRIQSLQDATDEELAEALLTVETEMRARIKAHIELDKPELKLVKGKGDTLVAELCDLEEELTAGDFIWTSSDESIVTVDAKGQIKGIAVGRAVITCSTLLSNGFDIKAECPVEVYIPVNGIAVNPRALTITRGTQTQIEYTVTPADATYPAITFTSSDEAVASVSGDGIITAVENGDCVITLSAMDGSEKKLDFKVAVRQEVQSIDLEIAENTVAVGKALQLKGTAAPEEANNKKLEWCSSDESIATVDARGTVKGVAPGTVRITAKATDGAGAEASVEIQVVQPMKTIAVVDNPVILARSTYWKQSAAAEPEDTTDKGIIWTSSNEEVATVKEDGTITAKAPGKCEVTGTAADGYGAKVVVKVEVREFQYVLRTPDEIDVSFETEETSSMMMGVTAGGSFMQKDERIIDFGNGCVRSDHPKKISPVKPGADQVTVILKTNDRVTSKIAYDIYVAQSAFEDTEELP